MIVIHFIQVGSSRVKKQGKRERGRNRVVVIGGLSLLGLANPLR